MSTVAITIPGEAVPFARSGGNGKVRFTPAPQRHYGNLVRTIAAAQMSGRPPLEGALKVTAEFRYIVPASWSKKRQAAAHWKTSKPDTDNLVKLIKDALNTIVWRDDAQVAALEVRKIYGPVTMAQITVERLEAAA